MRSHLWLAFVCCVILFVVGCTPAIPEETGPAPHVYFCPQDHCNDILAKYITSSTVKDCAFYAVNEPPVITGLTSARVVADADNQITGLAAHYDNRPAFMHNKFCVLDTGIITGSYNPTTSGADDYNNLLFIPSKHLRTLYEAEFSELWTNHFGTGTKTKQPMLRYNNYSITVLFCPEDACKKTVEKYLQEATRSIEFMTFSFTEEDLSRLLIQKHQQGVAVRGVMEGQRKTMQYEQYTPLKDAGIPIALENTGALLHHKVFIVDGRIVS